MQEGSTILDLGCGTGLSGEAFSDMADAIDGIDLSPAMIAKARARGTLSRTASSRDIETALDARFPSRYDLILAADTLVYLGDLEACCVGAAQSWLPGGTFLFTVEKKDGNGIRTRPQAPLASFRILSAQCRRTCGL